jgi:hypothetical protein
MLRHINLHATIDKKRFHHHHQHVNSLVHALCRAEADYQKGKEREKNCVKRNYALFNWSKQSCSTTPQSAFSEAEKKSEIFQVIYTLSTFNAAV